MDRQAHNKAECWCGINHRLEREVQTTGKFIYPTRNVQVELEKQLKGEK